MKGFTTLTVALFAVFASVEALPQRRGGNRGFRGNGRNRGGNTAVATPVGTPVAAPVAAPVVAVAPVVSATAAPTVSIGGATGGATGATAGGAVTRGDSTIVMKEVGGIPGNECLTFRNNGQFNAHRQISYN